MSNTITVERKKLEEIQVLIADANKSLKQILHPTPTMSEADWQRVIDEGFYVKRVKSIEKLIGITPLTGRFIFAFNSGSSDKPHEVVREKGLRQPHFVGDKHPEGDTEVWVQFYCDDAGNHPAKVVNWNHVREYVVL